MYTSLELAVQAAALMAHPIANFCTSKLVKVGKITIKNSAIEAVSNYS
jgi:hypothetical protein